MAHHIHITRKAHSDISSVVSWFQEQRATEASQEWINGLWKVIHSLENLPERCSMAAETENVGREIRELLYGKRRGKYRILFEIRDQTVYVLRFWHSARDAFTKDDL